MSDEIVLWLSRTFDGGLEGSLVLVGLLRLTDFSELASKSNTENYSSSIWLISDHHLMVKPRSKLESRRGLTSATQNHTQVLAM